MFALNPPSTMLAIDRRGGVVVGRKRKFSLNLRVFPADPTIAAGCECLHTGFTAAG
jgi:hypothetical protein